MRAELRDKALLALAAIAAVVAVEAIRKERRSSITEENSLQIRERTRPWQERRVCKIGVGAPASAPPWRNPASTLAAAFCLPRLPLT